MATSNKYLAIGSGINRLFITIALGLLLAACTASQSGTTPSSAESENATAVAPEAYEGDGLEIPLDGSSLAAFDASLARVKLHTPAESYLTLENAIDYLLVYDLGAKKNRETLAARLNGLTGYQVIAKVGWRKPAPGKSNAEKGATDVKIIDT